MRELFYFNYIIQIEKEILQHSPLEFELEIAEEKFSFFVDRKEPRILMCDMIIKVIFFMTLSIV